MPQNSARKKMQIAMAAIFAAIFLMSCSNSTLDERLRDADALLSLGNPKKAVAMLERAAKKYPEDERRPGIMLHAARINDIFLGNKAEAIRLMGIVADEYPLSVAAAIAREHRARLYQDAGQFDLAAEDLSFLIKNDPANAEKHRLLLAGLYMDKPDYEQARVELLRLIRDKKTSEEVLEQAAFFYSESLFLEGKSELASRWLSAFIKEFPKSAYVPEAKVHLATCLEESGKLGAAMNVLGSAKGYPNKEVINIRMKSMEDRGSPQTKDGGSKAATGQKKRR